MCKNGFYLPRYFDYWDLGPVYFFTRIDIFLFYVTPACQMPLFLLSKHRDAFKQNIFYDSLSILLRSAFLPLFLYLVRNDLIYITVATSPTPLSLLFDQSAPLELTTTAGRSFRRWPPDHLRPFSIHSSKQGLSIRESQGLLQCHFLVLHSQSTGDPKKIFSTMTESIRWPQRIR